MKTIGCLKKSAALGLMFLMALPNPVLSADGKEKKILFIESPASEKQLTNFISVFFNETNEYTPKGPRKSITVVVVFDPGNEPSFAAWVERQSKKKPPSKVEVVFETLSDNQPLSRIRLKGLRLNRVHAHKPENNLTEATFTANNLTRELIRAEPPADPH